MKTYSIKQDDHVSEQLCNTSGCIDFMLESEQTFFFYSSLSAAARDGSHFPWNSAMQDNVVWDG